MSKNRGSGKDDKLTAFRHNQKHDPKIHPEMKRVRFGFTVLP